MANLAGLPHERAHLSGGAVLCTAQTGNNMRAIFAPKLLGESPFVTFDFTDNMSAGETISTSSVTATVYSGTDPSPSSLISGITSNSAGVVTQKLTGGVLGVTYTLLCTAATSLGQTLQRSGYLAIVPNLS